MSKYVIYPDGRFDKIDELYHHGVKGQKWGVRRYQNKDGILTNAGKKKKKLTYREKVEQSMREYDKSHPERSKKDNYTISIRNEQRAQKNKLIKRLLASMLITPASFAIDTATGITVSSYIYKKRNNSLTELMDEYNIEKQNEL